ITDNKRIERKLNEYHNHLEGLVEDRTSELREANEALQAEIAERKRVELALQNRFEFEQLIATISARFINLPPETIDDEISKSLGIIGDFIGVDRSYAFLLS